MSSLEIAELTGKRHDNVMRDIRAMLEAVGGLLNFEGTYRDAKGETRPCFALPYDETLTLVAGYDAALRFKIVRRWREGASGAGEPRSWRSRGLLMEPLAVARHDLGQPVDRVHHPLDGAIQLALWRGPSQHQHTGFAP